MGFAQGVIDSLKYTRGLLKNKSPYFSKAKSPFKYIKWNIPKRTLSDFRKENALDKKRRSIIAYLFSVLVFSSILFVLLSNISSPKIKLTSVDLIEYDKSQKTLKSKKSTELFLNSGFKNLSSERLNSAQLDFKTVLIIDKYNLYANIGMSRALTLRCLRENYACPLAKEYVLFTKTLKTSDHKELNELLKLLDDKENKE